MLQRSTPASDRYGAVLVISDARVAEEHDARRAIPIVRKRGPSSHDARGLRRASPSRSSLKHCGSLAATLVRTSASRRHTMRDRSHTSSSYRISCSFRCNTSRRDSRCMCIRRAYTEPSSTSKPYILSNNRGFFRLPNFSSATSEGQLLRGGPTLSEERGRAPAPGPARRNPSGTATCEAPWP
jgi:hypothetical protein